MAIVQILGTAPNLALAPLPQTGTDVWCANQRRGYRKWRQDGAEYWTHWFNFHHPDWIEPFSPQEWKRLRELDTTRPVYLQDRYAAVPASQRFPREELQQHFAVDGKPNRFFTFSGSWLIARAIHLGCYHRIELWGFQQRQEYRYAFERPSFFYWVEVARSRGIEVSIPPDMVVGPPGDPREYDGPMYGYETHGCVAPPGLTQDLLVGFKDLKSIHAQRLLRDRRRLQAKGKHHGYGRLPAASLAAQ